LVVIAIGYYYFRKPPQPQGLPIGTTYVQKMCNGCNGQGRVQKYNSFEYIICTGCSRAGKVFVPEPPQICAACNGQGRVQKYDSGEYVFCNGCGGNGWAWAKLTTP